MTPRRKQAITYLLASVPMLWWGFTQFELGGHDHGMAIALSISCTFGILFAICGLVMLFTNKQLGETPMKEETSIRLAPEQTELFEDNERVSSADTIREFRLLGVIIAESHKSRADMRATLKGRGIEIEEDGTIEVT